MDSNKENVQDLKPDLEDVLSNSFSNININEDDKDSVCTAIAIDEALNSGLAVSSTDEKPLFTNYRNPNVCDDELSGSSDSEKVSNISDDDAVSPMSEEHGKSEVVLLTTVEVEDIGIESDDDELEEGEILDSDNDDFGDIPSGGDEVEEGEIIDSDNEDVVKSGDDGTETEDEKEIEMTLEKELLSIMTDKDNFNIWPLMSNFFDKGMEHQKIVFDMFTNVQKVILINNYIIIKLADINNIVPCSTFAPEELTNHIVSHLKEIIIDSARVDTFAFKFLMLLTKKNYLEIIECVRFDDDFNVDMRILNDVIHAAEPKSGELSVTGEKRIFSTINRPLNKAIIKLADLPIEISETLCRKQFGARELHFCQMFHTVEGLKPKKIRLNQVNDLFKAVHTSTLEEVERLYITCTLQFSEGFEFQKLANDISRLFPNLIEFGLNIQANFMYSTFGSLANIKETKNKLKSDMIEMDIPFHVCINFNPTTEVLPKNFNNPYVIKMLESMDYNQSCDITVNDAGIVASIAEELTSVPGEKRFNLELCVQLRDDDY